MEELLSFFPDISDEAKKELEKALLNKYKQGRSDQIKEQEKKSLDSALNEALEKAGAIDATVSRTVIDMDSVVYESGEFLGLTEEIDRIKKEYGFLFHQEVPQFSRGTTGSGEVDVGALNYLERLKLYRENPELYRLHTNK